jgi:hypothetical protein
MELQMRGLPGSSGAAIAQHTNTHITQNNTRHKEQNSIQIYTNNEGHITANEYNAKIEKLKLSLLQAFEAY